MLIVLIILRKKMDEVGQRQHQRKIKELKTKVEQALWFFESYGVPLSTICVEDSHGNQSDISPGKTSGEKVSKYNLLPETRGRHVTFTFWIDSVLAIVVIER